MFVDPKSWRAFSIPIGGLLWLLLVGFGSAELERYSVTAGQSGRSPDRWPTASSLRPVPGLPTLVMVVHPRCACSRASLYELGRALGRGQGKMAAYVLFVVPAGADREWLETDLWRSASLLPGVLVVRDVGGGEARRFGATTSGHTALYAGDGRLLFSGGVTAGRGHVGDNPGVASVVSFVRAGRAEHDHTPVFGCPLFDPEARCLEGGPLCPKHAS